MLSANVAAAAGARSVAAPAYRALAYPAPEPGSYELPPLGAAADGAVLDTSGTPRRLFEYVGDRLVVLSLVYTSCRERSGCPMASFVLGRIGNAVAEDPALASQTRLVTLSFDPRRDTPETMRRYAARLRGAEPQQRPDWAFLTTASQSALAPILAAYDQSITLDRDEDGDDLGTISHVLRVFLIDGARRIRNVYSASFLHADTVLADLRTLAMELDPPPPGATDVDTADSGAPAEHTPSGPATRTLHGAGDSRDGYDDAGYSTRSRSIADRGGRAANLVALATAPALGLPPLPVPDDDPLTAAKVALGRKLFFDRRLSRNATISCAMCHVPEQGFTSQEMATAVGIGGRTVRRNAPTLYNVAYARTLFHDGRERRLEQQIWGPLLAANEMGNPSVGFVLDTISALPDYADRFEAAFDGRGPSMETLGRALAAYQRTILSAASPFDRWRYGGEPSALSPAALRGHELFAGKAGCTSCHHIGERAALLTDHGLHDTGIGYRRSMSTEPAARRVHVAPGVVVEVDTSTLGSAAEPRPSDLGRYEITGDPADRWKYRTPSLRNVALTAPYMHDGSLPTLRSVVEFYDAGGVEHELLDPAVRPLRLDDTEIDDLVAFLESLTGTGVDVIVADAFAAPVGDPD